MYFPTSTARQLSAVPPLPNLPAEPVIWLSQSPRKSLFCSVTRLAIAVWRVRVSLLCSISQFQSFLQPTALLAFLARTPTSILDHGDNLTADWSPDGSRIVIQVLASKSMTIGTDFLKDHRILPSARHRSVQSETTRL